MILWDGLGLIGLALLGLWLFALVDCISTDASLCRNLPKGLWLIIVFILPDVGSILWLMLGRPQRAGWTPGNTDYAQPRRPIAVEDSPRYSPIAGVTDRRSAELDREIDAWEVRQRELDHKEAELRQRELDLRERELEQRERKLTDE
jgi:hypothetical protein